MLVLTEIFHACGHSFVHQPCVPQSMSGCSSKLVAGLSTVKARIAYGANIIPCSPTTVLFFAFRGNINGVPVVEKVVMFAEQSPTKTGGNRGTARILRTVHLSLQNGR